MKKLYLFVFLIVAAFSAKAQYDDFDQIIERDILGSANIIEDQTEKKQVIRAARSMKSADELPVTLYIISHDEIINHGYITLCDVLKNVPGIRVSQPANYELGEGFIQRGMTGNIYTKILVNDVDIKASGMTGMALGANLPIRQAKWIEIIYGPASASYGNDACGGVINIVTMTPEQKDFSSADLMVGTGGKRYVNFNTGTKIGHGKHVAQLSFYGSNLDVDKMNLPDETYSIYNRWNYIFQTSDYVEMNASDGNTYKISPSMVTPEAFAKYSSFFSDMMYYFINYEGNDVHDGSMNDGFYKPAMCDRPQSGSQLGFELKYGIFSFSYNLLHRMDYTNHGNSPFTYNYEDNHALSGEYVQRYVLSTDFTKNNFSSNTILHFINYRVDKNSCRSVNWNPEYLYYWGASDDLGFEENISWKGSDKFFLNGGFSYQYSGVLPKTTDNEHKVDYDSYKIFGRTLNSNDTILGQFGIYPYRFWQTGTYLQADYSIGSVSFTGGLRYDYNSRWGGSFNPRIAALWKVTKKLTFRASQGYAYKSPSGNQEYYTVAIPMTLGGKTYVAYHHIPSVKELKPEHVSSTEVGLRYYFNKTNYAEIVGYTNTVKDPLVRDWVPLTSAYAAGVLVDGYTPVGVSDWTNSKKDRVFTRAFTNKENAKTKLYGLQFIGVMKDVYKPMRLNFSAAVTLSKGYEYLSNNDAIEEEYFKENFVRGVPKTMAQVSVDFDFWKIMHMRLDNIYCSKFARKYYQGVDNIYFWSPSYYTLDVVLSAKLAKKVSALFKVQNVTNNLYGGMDSFEMDIDLPYNPQMLRTFTVGVTYGF
ncbi:MAG: TonB-dependent receptor [Bacteroidales bacterium]|nr:TonB-dependent receptor [Bacteroidales bacterium]